MGSTRWELDPGERSVFIDFLCLAGADDGFIRANPTTAYPIEYLAGMLQAPAELILRTIEKCILVGKITRLKDGVFYINSWKDYQLDPRRKRELMHEGPDDAHLSSSLDSRKEGREEILDLDDTERSAGCEPQIRRVLGANEEAALDKEIVKVKAEGAPLEAELGRRRKS